MENSRNDIVYAPLSLPIFQTDIDACDASLAKLPKEPHADTYQPLPQPHAYAHYQPSQTNPVNIGELPAHYASLPITMGAQDIADSLHRFPVTCVLGYKGCGKSTFIPYLILQVYAGYRVYMVSPYEASATLLAYKLCSERGLKLGIDIGLHTPNRYHGTPETPLMICTPEVVVRRLQNGCDPRLERSVMVLDDIHERHPYTDLLLLVAKQNALNRNQRVVLIGNQLESSELPYRLRNYFEDAMQGVFNDVQLGQFQISEPEYWKLDRVITQVRGVDAEDADIENDIRALSPMNVEAEKLADIGIVPIVAKLHNEWPLEWGAFIVVAPSPQDCAVTQLKLSSIYVSADRGLVVSSLHEQTTVEDAINFYSSLRGSQAGRQIMVTTHAMLGCCVTLYPRIALLLDTGKKRFTQYNPIDDTLSTANSYVSQDEFLCGLKTLQGTQRVEDNTEPLHIALLMEQQIMGLARDYDTQPIQTSPRLPDLILNTLVLTDALMQKSAEAVIGQLLSYPAALRIEAALNTLERQSLITNKRVPTSFGRVVSHLGPLPIQPARLLLYGLVVGALRPMLYSAAALSAGYPGVDLPGPFPGACETAALSALVISYLREDDKQGFCKSNRLNMLVMQRIVTTADRYEKLLTECALVRSGTNHSPNADNIEIVRHATVSALYPRIFQTVLAGTSVTFPNTKSMSLPKAELVNRFQNAPSPYPDGTLLTYVTRVRRDDDTIELTGISVVPPLSLILCCGSGSLETIRKPTQVCRGWYDDDDEEAAKDTSTEVACYVSAQPDEPCELRLDRCIYIPTTKNVTSCVLNLRRTFHAYVLNTLAITRAFREPITLPPQFAEVLPQLLSVFNNFAAEAKFKSQIGKRLNRLVIEEKCKTAVNIYCERVAADESGEEGGVGEGATKQLFDPNVLIAPAPEGVTTHRSGARPPENPLELKVILRTIDLIVRNPNKAFEINLKKEVADKRAFRFMLDYHTSYAFYIQELRKARKEKKETDAKLALLDPAARAIAEAIQRAKQQKQLGDSSSATDNTGFVEDEPSVPNPDEPSVVAAPGVPLAIIQVEYSPPHILAAFALTRRSTGLDAIALNLVMRMYSGDYRSRLFPSVHRNRKLLLPTTFVPIETPEGQASLQARMSNNFFEVPPAMSMAPPPMALPPMVAPPGPLQPTYPSVTSTPMMTSSTKDKRDRSPSRDRKKEKKDKRSSRERAKSKRRDRSKEGKRDDKDARRRKHE